MAGRGYKKVSYKCADNRQWQFGVYTRRSFDDCDDNESNTIKNQKKLIDDYLIKENNITIFDYYIDDGYTGTNFNRPDFKRMLQDIYTGKINGIIFKDFSRFGRNHKEAGKYIEEIFPMYNLRIISILDNVDSFLDPDSIESLIIPIKNLMNENYSRDLSKKVSSAYITMAKSGQYVSGTPPYGYMIDPKDKHHLIPEPYESEIVKQIYDMALNGYGRIKIAKYLNENGVLCRKELQRRKKENLSLDPYEVDSISFWGTTQVGRILTSETYIGNLAQLKTKRASFGADSFVTKNENEWIKVSGTHEPIISVETFKKVKEIIKSNEKEKKDISNHSIYNRILKCADCGRAMYKQEDYRGNRKISNYYCSTYLRTGKFCSLHKIKTSELDHIVLETIQLQIKLVIELEKSIMMLYFKNNKNLYEEEYKNRNKIIEIKINNLRDKKKKSYEDWKFELITKSEFIKESSLIEEEIKKLNEEKNLYDSTYRETIKRIRKDDYWISHYKRNKKIKKVTKGVLNDLIQSISITETGNVKIVFKYQDEYLDLLHYLESVGDSEYEKMDIRCLSKIIG